MVRICIRMLQIPFEWFEFAFECFQSISNGLNLHSNASNLVRKVRICIRMLSIPFEWFEFALEFFESIFEWFEFAFECFQSISYGLNLHSNASNLVRRVRICIQMLQIPFKWFEFALEFFESIFEWFEFGFECFESHSKGSNLHSNLHLNASNLVQILQIWFECY